MLIDLEEGTMVEVIRTRLVSQICIVQSGNPLILRPATAIERFKYWWKCHRWKSGELAAATEAIEAISKAKEKA